MSFTPTLIRTGEDLQSLLNDFQRTYGTITTFDEYVEEYSGLSGRDINLLKINQWQFLRERGQWPSPSEIPTIINPLRLPHAYIINADIERGWKPAFTVRLDVY